MTLLENHEVVVEVGGKPLEAAAEKRCEHKSFGASVVVADVLGASGELDHREARMRLRCTECGIPCEIQTTGRPPADGEPGVVVTFRPLDHVPSATVSLGGPHAG